MTDQKDYTQESEVLKALGWDSRTFDGAEKWWRVGEYPTQWPTVTLSELWEGLCRVCRETGWFQPVLYGDAETLISGPDPMGERVFKVNEYGSLPNAVAAALYWVLQRGGGG